MDDQHVLGINSDHGLRLVSVMGNISEVFGLVSYQGTQGANLLVRLLRREFGPEAQDVIYYQDALLVDLVPRHELRKEDRAILEQAQFKPASSKPKRFPKFVSYKPGYLPWFPNEAEVRCLLDDLQKVIRFAHLLKDNPNFRGSHPVGEFPFFPNSVTEPLTLAQFDWQPISPTPLRLDPPIDPKSLGLEGKVRHPQSGAATWELAAFYSNMSISQGPRPYWPKMALAVESKTGMVLGYHLGDPEHTMADVAAGVLLKSIEKTGGAPATLHVDSLSLFRSLQPLAEALGTKLVQTQSLPMLREARQSLEAYNRGM